jgi:uncharacterized repeat protein (TIGR01451 family)
MLCALVSQAVVAQQSTGSAFGESVDLSIRSVFNLATVEAQSGPLPQVGGGTPPDFAASDNLLGVDVNANISLLGPLLPVSSVDILSTGVLNVAASGDSGPAADASASVDSVSLELLGDALLPLVLGISADAITSSAVAGGSCESGLTASGSSSLVNASLASALGELAGIVGNLDASPAPNTVLLDLDLLGGHLRIVLNEQIVSGDGVSSRGITVNALHVTIEDIPVAALITDINGDVIIAQSQAAVTCATADIAITKTDSVDPVVVGNPLAYTLQVSNAGPDTATNVVVEDALPAGVTFGTATPSQGSCSQAAGVVSCDLGDLASGAVATVLINVTPTATGNLSNSATVSADAADPDRGNNTATELTTVNPAAGAADLAVALTESADPVTAGDPLTITVDVANAGPDAADNTVLVYTPPATVTLGTVVPSQGSCSVNATQVVCDLGGLASGAGASVDIQMAAPVPGVLNHLATASSNVTDPDPVNNSATEQTTVVANAGLSADIGLVKTDSADPALVGQPLTYTLAVTNNGPDAAGAVVVSDTLPGSVTFVSATATQGACVHAAGLVTCNLGALGNGAGASVAVVVIPTVPGNIDNTATVTADVSDPNPADNTDSEATTISGGAADLAITNTGSPDPVAVGEALSYLLDISNNGPDDATLVQVVDTLPAGVTFASAVPSQGSCTETAGTVTCDLGSIASGGGATITVLVNPTVIGSLVNVAVVDSQLDDPDLDNNTASATTEVVEGTVVQPPGGAMPIPALGAFGPAALALLVLGAGLAGRRRVF